MASALCRPTFACLLVLALPGAVRADSPLSSTDLAAAYLDLAVVRDVRTSRELDADALTLLVGAGHTDQKAAVVSALGWGGDAARRALPFVKAVAAARGVRADDLRLDQLTASDRFVLGYLLAMGTNPGPLTPGANGLWGATPRELLAQAASALPRDFTVQYVRGLAEAQAAMSTSWCAAYMATQPVLQRFPPPQRNLRAKAVAQAQAYMDGYKKECGAAPTSTVAAPGKLERLGPEANQIYQLARLGQTVLAATQAGAVVWDPARKEPLAMRREELCVSVVVVRDAGWFGCGERVWRWDGAAWKSYLHDPTGSEGQYEMLVDPHGVLLARHGKGAQAYDPARDAFTPTASLGTDPTTAIVRANGEVWWIEFLKAVHGPRTTYRLRTPEYPGKDPRKLVEDAKGRLWVVDFGSGFFRLGADDRFEHEAGVDEKGSAMAVDEAHGRTWLLHYTKGPVLLVDGAAPRPFDTSDLGYMRDLMVDPDGSLWIAGWNKLLHLRDTPQGWKRDELVVK
jgi:hypothetical protein